jgi:hypothetical protein
VGTLRDNGEEYGVTDEIEFELEEWQNRCDALRLRDERDDLKDVAEDLHNELEDTRRRLKEATSVISRLRTHIAQGIEL